MTQTAITGSRGRAWLMFTIASMLLTTCFVLLVITDVPKYKADVEREANLTFQWLDADTAQAISEKVRLRQMSWIYESGLYPAVKNALQPKQVDYIETASKGVFSTKWNERLLINMQYMAFQFIHRFTLLEFWLWSLLPLMIATIVTGIYKWKIKQYQLGGQSVNVSRLWLKVFWALGTILSVYLFAPSIIGTISIYVPAVFLITCAFAIAQVIQSYNKYI